MDSGWFNSVSLGAIGRATGAARFRTTLLGSFPSGIAHLKNHYVLLYILLAALVALAPVVFAPELYDDFTLPKQALLFCTAGFSVVLLAFSGRGLLPMDTPLKIAFIGLFVAITMSFILAKDVRGSLFGYYQYREGYLTQAAMLVLFLGTVHIAPRYSTKAMLWAGIAGLIAVVGYAALQATGNDPFRWWIDTSERAIATIGNANELAGYVLLSFAFGGALALLKSPWRSISLACFAAALTFTLLATESRSGLLCAAVLLITFPLASTIVGIPKQQLLLGVACLFVGVGLGIWLSLWAGVAQETAIRFTSTVPLATQKEDGSVSGDIAGSTRLAMWRGTFPVILRAPFFGHGPDGISLSFPETRPEGLGGYFLYQDLTVQSSHNWFLDQAANSGFIGLGLLLLLLALVGYRSLHFEKGRGAVFIPYLWAGLLAYGSFVMLNQLSIGVHAVFIVLLGLLAGRATEAPAITRPALRLTLPYRQALKAISVAICVGLMALAGISLGADVLANFGYGSSVNKNFTVSAAHYGHASTLNPFERVYLQGESNSWMTAGACQANFLYMRQAERKLTVLTQRFEPTAGDLLSLAKVKIALGRGPEAIEPLLVRAKELNSKGIEIDTMIQQLRDAALLRNYVLVYNGRSATETILLVPVREAVGLATAEGCVTIGPRSPLPLITTTPW